MEEQIIKISIVENKVFIYNENSSGCLYESDNLTKEELLKCLENYIYNNI